MDFNDPKNIEYNPDRGEEDEESEFSGYHLHLSPVYGPNERCFVRPRPTWQVYGRVPLVYAQVDIPWIADEDEYSEAKDEEYPEEEDEYEKDEDSDDGRGVMHQINAIFVEEYYEEVEDWRVPPAGTAIPQAGIEVIGTVLRPKPIKGLNVVFTDGSFVSPNKSGYGIFMGMGHPLNRAVKLAEPHNSARAEVQAMLQSLLALLKWDDRPETEVNIYTDCLFAIQALHHVRARRIRKKEPRMDSNHRECLENLISSLNEEFNVLITLAHRFEEGVRISFIKSHCGEYGNERADLYATIGRTGDVRNAMRLKSWNDSQRTTPYDIIRRINNRPYIEFRPTRAERNMSHLVLNIEDRKNSIMYPRQQIVWSPDHPSIEEQSIKCDFD